MLPFVFTGSSWSNTPVAEGVVAMAGTPVNVVHHQMATVVKSLDTLIDDLNSKGTSGSYASMQDAAMLAEAVCSVNQKEMGAFVQQYNQGFGHAANVYREFCTLLVSIRNAVATTANIHLENDALQAKAFAPLKAETWKQASGHDNPAGSGSGSGSGSGAPGGSSTTIEAPGPLGQTTRPSSGADPASV